MAKMKDWLAEFAASRRDKVGLKREASVKREAPKKNAAPKVTKRLAEKVKKAQVLIMSRDALPGAVNGNTVRYNNAKWRVVNASYKDALGTGVALERVAAIDTKKLTDAPTRAYTDPGDVYDYDVREVSEIPDFQEAAARTEQEIARDRAHDITTPAGRVTNPEPIGGNPFDDLAGPIAEEPAVEEPAVEELPPADEPVPAGEFDDIADEPVEEFADKPTDEPAPTGEFDDIVDEPADGPAEEPVEEPTEEPEDEEKEEKKFASVYKTNPILRKIVGGKCGCGAGECTEDTKEKKSVYRTNPILRKIVEKKTAKKVHK